ncbi:E3 ubiquitin-protein ligase [Apostasia shenzhenica]|uniref:RING-type E3 ubiquitin transferase n=1 Tax=Apostasia shenzhenica TaxID=1088818 RepID=A0A2I0AXJ0_9ASPA|nr:E3 ubiquitin-protein ligase [Apostasia shenzhenica]
MGSFCCCPCGEDFEEYTHPNNPVYRHCMCLKYFLHQLFSGHGVPFQRFEGRTSTVQASPLASTAVTSSDDGSLSDTFNLIPRPPPYESEPRYSRLQRDGLISRRDKATGHIPDNTQIRRSGSSSDFDHGGKKWKDADFEEKSKMSHLEMEKDTSAKAYGTGYGLTNLEDEDVCPTCLDEYTPENPKIETKCSHHFHLSCIYEWMERSDLCPICGKEMEFCESP